MQAYKLEASTRKKVLVNKFDLQMDNNLRDKDGSEVVSADDNVSFISILHELDISHI